MKRARKDTYAFFAECTLEQRRSLTVGGARRLIEHQLPKNHAGQIVVYLAGDKAAKQQIEFQNEEELQVYADRDHDGVL